jgi:hypothetical protein
VIYIKEDNFVELHRLIMSLLLGILGIKFDPCPYIPPYIWFPLNNLTFPFANNFYTPATRRGSGVYCFTSVRLSLRPSEKCNEKCAYMFNVYKNQLSPKTLPTIWYTYMTIVTKYQISAIYSYWEKCDEKYLGRTEGRRDRRTEVKQYTPLPLRVAGV